MLDQSAIDHAADLIEQADALVVAAGAGMGIDSGLPDFRGKEGFWRAYPALGRRGLQFGHVASQQAFESEPKTAWGFYGHRLDLYRRTLPHPGFGILRNWGESMLHGSAVFTSNVDGHFQRAGFDDSLIVECHGSIHHLQCTKPCSSKIWPAEGFTPELDEDRCLLANAVPQCPDCGAVARPNVMMFGDLTCHAQRVVDQERRLQRWLAGVSRIVVVEIGAGTSIPSVRNFSHEMVIEHDAMLIRINPFEASVPRSLDVSIVASALAALSAIQDRLTGPN